jgi:hypothetical protein
VLGIENATGNEQRVEMRRRLLALARRAHTSYVVCKHACTSCFTAREVAPRDRSVRSHGRAATHWHRRLQFHELVLRLESNNRRQDVAQCWCQIRGERRRNTSAPKAPHEKTSVASRVTRGLARPGPPQANRPGSGHDCY